MELGTRRFRRAIDAAAELYRLPAWQEFTAGAWFEGLLLTESSGDPTARRYERHQDLADRRDAATDPDQPGVDDGRLEDDASYGLGQVMGYNLRRLVGAPPGTRLDFTFALDPWFGLGASCRVLVVELAATGGDVARGPGSIQRRPDWRRPRRPGEPLSVSLRRVRPARGPQRDARAGRARR